MIPERVFVCGRFAREIARVLSRRRPELRVRVVGPEEVSSAGLGPRDALLAFRLPPEVLRSLPEGLWIHSIGAGVDGLLVDGLPPPGVRITRTRGVFGGPIAEWVAARLLFFTQRIGDYLKAQRRRAWIGDVLPAPAAGRRAVVVGLGDIGRVTARRLRALDLEVVGVSRSGRPVEGVERVLPASALDDALPEADVLVVLCPLTRETRGLIDARRIALLPRGAILLDPARGGIVDERALARALRAGRLASAALDVFEREPLDPSSPLWDVPNLLISPHVAAVTTPEQAVEAFLDALDAWAAGRRPDGLVDPERGY